MSNIHLSPFSTTIPGYPRVASHRVYKSLLERFWGRKISEAEFQSGVDALRTERLLVQADSGLDLIPCGDFSLYDHVLDTALQFGCVPDRFSWDGGAIGHDLYFAIARGRTAFLPPK